MEFVVAIPSYQRPEQLRDQTLAFLTREQISEDRITIFVASEEEKLKYTAVLGNTYSIVVGVLGLSEQLNFIFQYYPEGTRILRLDDDIRDFKWLVRQPLLELIESMFEIADREGIHLWGIYPASNVGWLKDRVAIGKVFCVGPVSGYINDRRFTYPPNASNQEDVRHSIARYLLDGKTMRYEGCFPVTKWRAKGGLSDYRKEHEEEDINSALAQFPTELKIRIKGGRREAHFRTKIEKTIQIDWSTTEPYEPYF